MSDFKPHPSRISPHDAPVPGDEAASPPSSSGRAAFDHRGVAVWEWKTETGHFSRSVSTTRVQKLEAPELSIEKTFIAKKPEVASQEVPAPAERGYNPYDRAVPQPGKAVASGPATRVPPTKPPTPVASHNDAGALSRLRSWFGSR